MIIDHLRRVIDELAEQPTDVQEHYATEIERELTERRRIARQLADPQETDLNYLLEEARREIAAGDVSDLEDIL